MVKDIFQAYLAEGCVSPSPKRTRPVIGSSRWIAFRTKATCHAFVNPFAEKAIHRFAIWNRISRELITEIPKFELQPCRELNRVLDGAVDILEERRHRLGGTKMSLAIQ